MAAGQPTITVEHLSDDFLDDARAAAAQAADEAPTAPAVAAPAVPPPRPVPAPAMPPAPPVAGRSLEEIEIETIRLTLEAVGGNISEASKRLGISRNTIYRKLRWNRN
jgi:transcriptional regulator of acetoin/glycerol metabolism